MGGDRPQVPNFNDAHAVSLQQPRVQQETFIPTAPIEVDRAVFPIQSAERKLPMAIHLWLHENCPPAMNAIITVSPTYFGPFHV